MGPLWPARRIPADERNYSTRKPATTRESQVNALVVRDVVLEFLGNSITQARNLQAGCRQGLPPWNALRPRPLSGCFPSRRRCQGFVRKHLTLAELEDA